jgi:hypothetical protein
MCVRWLFALAVLAALTVGCGGGGVQTTPVANSAPGSQVVAPFATPSAAGSPSVTQTSLPASGNGQAYGFADLAQFLVAAQPVAASASGTFGTITSIAGRTITLAQSGLAGATDATGAAPDFVQNYASVGTPNSTVTVVADTNAIVATPNGFADLRAGQTILAGGTASGTQLTAEFIDVLADAGTASTQQAVRRPQALSSAPPTDPPSPPANWVSGTGTFTGSQGVPGGIHLSGESPTFVTSFYSCSLPFQPSSRKGNASISVKADLALSLPQVVANFPFRIDYNPMPYVVTSTGFSSPGAMSSWLNFVPVPASAPASTYDVHFRADASVSLVVTDTCTGGSYTIAGGTVGYGYEVASAYGLPGNGQTIQLLPVKCIDINYPLHFTFPVNGTKGINPIGNSQAGLSVCAFPTVKGEQNINASLINLQQVSSSGGQAIFDPSQTGSATVVSAPLLNPTGPSAAFTLANMTDLVFQQDAQTLEYSLFGICVAGVPSCSSAPDATGVPIIPPFTTSLSASNVPVQLSAQAGVNCVGFDGRSATDSTNCLVQLKIVTASANDASLNPQLPNSTTAEFEINGLRLGSNATWNPADTGGSGLLPPCSGSNYAPYFSVTPSGPVSGSSITFTFTRNGNTGSMQSACAGTFLDQNGNVIKAVGGIPVEPSILVDEFAM